MINRRMLAVLATAGAVAVVLGMGTPVQAAPPAAAPTAAAPAAVPSAGNVGNDPRCRYEGRIAPTVAAEYLSVAAGGGSGTRVLLWSDTGGPEQIWCEEYSAYGTSILHPSYNLGLCLDVPGGRFTRGTAMRVWTCNGRISQRFARRYPLPGSGVLSWRTFIGGMCLDNGNFNQGNVVQLWTCNAGEHQQWHATSTTASSDGLRSNGLGERIAWDAWQQLGDSCWGSRAISNPFHCAGDWCTYFSKGVWSQNGVQGTGVINGLAASFADGDAVNGTPNGQGYGASEHTFTKTPHVGDALVWLDPEHTPASEQPWREHAEIVVWVDPANPDQVETIGGNENGSKVQVRGAGRVDHGDPSALFGSWGTYSWRDGVINGDGHQWAVYNSEFVRPVNT
jgi:hypothetical protein